MHTAGFFTGAIVCDNGRRGPIVGLSHSDFLSSEVSTHGLISCRKQLWEKIGPIFYWTKSKRTRTDFHSNLI